MMYTQLRSNQQMKFWICLKPLTYYVDVYALNVQTAMILRMNMDIKKSRNWKNSFWNPIE